MRAMEKKNVSVPREPMEASESRQPKYKAILENLRQSLASGEYRAGERLPSDEELTRRFAVSRMTVVKAMQELQASGLVVRRVGSGTYAAANSGQEGYLFGLLIPELGQTEIFEPICQGMAKSPVAAKHSLLWGNSSAGLSKEHVAERLCHQYISQKVSGVFFAPLELTPAMEEVNRRVVASLDRARIPVILLDRSIARYPERDNYDLVGIDNRRAAFQLTEHLVGAGAKKIAFWARRLSASTVESRIAGYREALFAQRLLHTEDLVFFGDPCDQALVHSVLRKHKPDAFFCANDHTAANLMQSLLALGAEIPEKIKIAGIDDVKYASLLPIPLTTQHQPCLGIGAVAMAAMIERLTNPDLPARDIRLSCRLVVRKSSGAEPRAAASKL